MKVYHLSECRNCRREIVWDEHDGQKTPFDPEYRNGVLLPGISHWKTCPHLEKLKAQRNCPACLILKDGLQTIVDIKLTNDLCKPHEEAGTLSIYFHGRERTVSLDYKSLSAIRRDVKEQIAKHSKVRKQIDESGGGLTKFFE